MSGRRKKPSAGETTAKTGKTRKSESQPTSMESALKAAGLIGSGLDKKGGHCSEGKQQKSSSKVKERKVPASLTMEQLVAEEEQKSFSPETRMSVQVKEKGGADSKGAMAAALMEAGIDKSEFAIKRTNGARHEIGTAPCIPIPTKRNEAVCKTQDSKGEEPEPLVNPHPEAVPIKTEENIANNPQIQPALKKEKVVVTRTRSAAPIKPVTSNKAQKRANSAPEATKPVKPRLRSANGLEYITLDRRSEFHSYLFENEHTYHYTPLRNKSTRAFRSSSNEDAKGVMDLVVGLDFGTSSVKVVVQEQSRSRAWAIPFTDDIQNPYLLPSTVYLLDGIYSLEQNGTAVSDLKMPLLRSTRPKGHLDSVIAFLALVLRHVGGWLYENLKDELKGYDVEWTVNLGIPAANYENTKLISTFKLLALSAANLAASSQRDISQKAVTQYLAKVRKAREQFDESDSNWPAQLSFQPFQVNLMPELAAQIHGYVSSDQWDRGRPKFMLVDIGGGTVDASIFNVTHDRDGNRKYSFFRSVVESLGALQLHAKRLGWITESMGVVEKQLPKLEAGLAQLREGQSPVSAIPDSVNQYLKYARYPGRTLDNLFYDAYHKQLMTEVIDFVRNKVDQEPEQWRHLAFLLCGGGSLNSFYRQFVDLVNAPGSGTNLGFDEIELEKPETLIAAELDEADYHRLSVAYGLSFLEIGDFITPENIKDYKLKQADRADRAPSRFISKEQM